MSPFRLAQGCAPSFDGWLAATSSSLAEVVVAVPLLLVSLLPASAAFPLAGERTAKTRLCVTFNGMITGHLGMMPLPYNGDGIYKSIIDGTKAKIKPLPKGLK